MSLNESYAIESAVNLAKIICANPNCHISPNAESAKDVAVFIKTLSDLLTQE